MYEGETEPIPRVTDRDEPDVPDRRAADRAPSGRTSGRSAASDDFDGLDGLDDFDDDRPAGGSRSSARGSRRGDTDSDEPASGRARSTGSDSPRAESPGVGSTHHHHHHHDHSPPPPASRRVRTLVAALLVPFGLAAVVGTVLLFPFGDPPEIQAGAGTPVHGVITAAEAGSCSGEVQVGEEQPGAPQCLVVTVRMTDGAAPNQEVRTVVPLEPSSPRFAVDDEVVLSYGGSNPLDGGSYQLVDFQRDVPLALLAGLFAVAVLVLGRWQGLKALVALGLSFLVLVFFVLPAIIAGESPLLVAICGAGVIMFAVLYLTHGFSARTSTAVLGTMVSLAMIGVLGALWAAFAKLTGLDEDTSTLVGLLNAPIDTRGLLLAGVVIGALGVLDDVTVTQTSAVWELRAANPLLSRRELYTSALRIGRDHVASAVNTLVMAYAGAALPLLLYSSISGVGLGSILTSQSIAQELVRTLVGSIGLVAAVPITTALAAAVAAQEPPLEPAAESRRPDHPDDRPARRTGRPTSSSARRPADDDGGPRRPRSATEGRSTRRPMDDTGERATRRPTAAAGDRSARWPADEVGERSATRQQPDERSARWAADGSGERSIRRPARGTDERSTRWPDDDTGERSARRPADEVGERSSRRPAGGTSGRSTRRTSEHGDEWPADRSSVEAGEETRRRPRRRSLDEDGGRPAGGARRDRSEGLAPGGGAELGAAEPTADRPARQPRSTWFDDDELG